MIALRLVLDTNVLVSAVLKQEGLERAVLNLALSRPARIYVSQKILEEYGDVLSRPELRIRKGLRRQFLALIKHRSRLVKPRLKIEIGRDPDDAKFLECADAARADYLVTGNLKHFPRYWKNTKIVKPREFIEMISPHLMSGI
ncbi:MAG TPA: putative toxin-antitoxin system toxin component, PIN family [Candidatus Sulfotelmatobacter sp.]|nr:putative toxin-antitoxin system toxin component, PIN family [Candidatus Sulfotelmatobacter sp.]